MQIETISFMLGAFLLFIAILGGGIEIKELKIPRVGRLARGLSALIGVAFVAISLWHGGLFVTAPEIIPLAQAPTVAPVAALTETNQPALPQQQTIAPPVPAAQVPVSVSPVAQTTAKPTTQRQIAATAAVAKPGKTIQPSTRAKTQVIKTTTVPASTPPAKSTGDSDLAKIKSQGEKLRKKIAFTIKAGLGTTPNSAETETEMRIYLEGEQAASFLLDLQSPSRSVSVKLDKPGTYKYYIEGHSSWNNIPNKKIPMEGKGVLTIERGGIYELWSDAAPTAKTQTWKVGLRSKK